MVAAKLKRTDEGTVADWTHQVPIVSGKGFEGAEIDSRVDIGSHRFMLPHKSESWVRWKMFDTIPCRQAFCGVADQESGGTEVLKSEHEQHAVAVRAERGVVVFDSSRTYIKMIEVAIIRW